MPAYFKQILYQNQYFVLQLVNVLQKSARKWDWKWNKDTICFCVMNHYSTLYPQTRLCNVQFWRCWWHSKWRQLHFPPLHMLLCGERDKIRLKKNSCCPTWIGPASIAAMSCLELALRAQGTNVSTVSIETSCPNTFSWFSLVTPLKDKEST